MLLGLAIFSVGCTGVGTTLQGVFNGAKRTVTATKQVETAQGPMRLYLFRDGDWCGEGVEMDGLNGEGAQPCSKMAILTQSGNLGADLALLFGRVNNPKVGQVVAVTREGERLTAEVGAGIWHLLLPGQKELPALDHLEGFDQAGERLISLPAR